MAYKYVCNKCGTKTTKPEPYGDYNCDKGGCDGHLAYYVDMPMPDPLVKGLAVTTAVNEFVGTDSDLAGALRMVFNKTAKGRSAPGSTTVNHIHVGGYGGRNLLFDSVSFIALGIVNGHMDRRMSPPVRNEMNRVMARFGGGTSALEIEGTTISKAT